MITLETLHNIDAVAAVHDLHPQDIRNLLSAQLPSWITPAGQTMAQVLLQTWLDPQIDLRELRFNPSQAILSVTSSAVVSPALEQPLGVSCLQEYQQDYRANPSSLKRAALYDQLAQQKAKKNFTQRLVERFGF
jgi:hypothetical protein